MKLENITLNEKNQTQRPHIIWFYLYEMSQTGKSIHTEGRLGGCQGLREFRGQ